jgi:CBS domain
VTRLNGCDQRTLVHSAGGRAHLVHITDVSGLAKPRREWPLEQAAAAMVRGGFRHIIALNGSEVAGILSMRDIVRCWTADGAACDVPAAAPSGVA